MTSMRLPAKVARRYDALLEQGRHQDAGALVERYRPKPTTTGAPA